MSNETIKDPLAAIQEGMAAPIEALEPSGFDSVAMEKAFNARNNNQISFPPFYQVRNAKLDHTKEALLGVEEK